MTEEYPKPEPTVSLKEHLLALAEANDRRYAEIAIEREKALKIKDEADKAALGLAREIQTYKDEKANELRSQIERERGSYATQGDLKAVVDKFEISLKPIADYVSVQQGKTTGLTAFWGIVVSLIIIAGVIVTIVTRSAGG